MIRVSDIQRMFNVKIRPVCHDKIKGLARKEWDHDTVNESSVFVFLKIFNFQIP